MTDAAAHEPPSTPPIVARTGPLAGVRVVELVGLGPAPFGAMVLADYGADVVAVDRPAKVTGAPVASARMGVFNRNRRSVAVDLKSAEGLEIVRRLVDGADVFVEGFRPGVAERLGLGPDVLCERNPGLVYARMTGWGQDGPWADRAGHDINYVAMAGPLAHIGRVGQPPTVPLNLVGDFGGGGLLMALGVCAALVEKARSGLGQVLDVAMVDGASLISAPMVPAYVGGTFSDERGTNMLDSGAPWYDVYETADGGWVSVGAIEPQFYVELLDGLGLADDDLPPQHDRSGWPVLRERFAAVIAGRTRAEWEAVFEHRDACVAPVLTYREAAGHPHLAARRTYLSPDGAVQPAPAPRFSRTPAAVDRPPVPPGHDTDAVLADVGLTAEQVADLRRRGVVA
ncbi:MAG: CoA transferase [Acidimicrobiales bacterium]|jgi:alpha-methylacyl-CoA racemase|nr:CoA transferase [Acidimicrobiales bacterium]